MCGGVASTNHTPRLVPMNKVLGDQKKKIVCSWNLLASHYHWFPFPFRACSPVLWPVSKFVPDQMDMHISFYDGVRVFLRSCTIIYMLPTDPSRASTAARLLIEAHFGHASGQRRSSAGVPISQLDGPSIAMHSIYCPCRTVNYRVAGAGPSRIQEMSS
jgi:hypothetical protein